MNSRTIRLANPRLNCLSRKNSSAFPVARYQNDKSTTETRQLQGSQRIPRKGTFGLAPGLIPRHINAPADYWPSERLSPWDLLEGNAREKALVKQTPTADCGSRNPGTRERTWLLAGLIRSPGRSMTSTGKSNSPGARGLSRSSGSGKVTRVNPGVYRSFLFRPFALSLTPSPTRNGLYSTSRSRRSRYGRS